jgi:amino acid transporter
MGNFFSIFASGWAIGIWCLSLLILYFMSVVMLFVSIGKTVPADEDAKCPNRKSTADIRLGSGLLFLISTTILIIGLCYFSGNICLAFAPASMLEAGVKTLAPRHTKDLSNGLQLANQIFKHIKK